MSSSDETPSENGGEETFKPVELNTLETYEEEQIRPNDENSPKPEELIKAFQESQVEKKNDPLAAFQTPPAPQTSSAGNGEDLSDNPSGKVPDAFQTPPPAAKSEKAFKGFGEFDNKPKRPSGFQSPPKSEKTAQTFTSFGEFDDKPQQNKGFANLASMGADEPKPASFSGFESFSEKVAKGPAPPPKKNKPPQKKPEEIEAERLKEITRKAYNDGYQKGEKQGYADGLLKGETEGHAKGFEKGEKEGYEKGFQKGEQKGLEDGLRTGEQKGEALTNEKSVAVLSRLDQIIAGIENVWGNLVATHEEHLVELVLKIAEKVIYGVLAIDRDIVKRTILEAFELMPNPENVTIHVNAEDYAYIEVVKEDFFHQLKSLKRVSVISDPAVPQGGVKLATETGEVHTNLEERLAVVTESIRQAQKKG